MFIRLTAALVGIAFYATAQQEHPVRWTFEPAQEAAAPGATAGFDLEASIDPGWHLYASTTPQGAPNALALVVTEQQGIAGWRGLQPEPAVQFDPNFQTDSYWYVDGARFQVEVDVERDAPAGVVPVRAILRYGVCNDKMCLPPKLLTLESALRIDPDAAGTFASQPGLEAMAAVEIPAKLLARAGVAPPEKATGVASGAAGGSAAAAAVDQGLVRFAAVAFGLGLLAIFTPCVFPMIPITMSYFVSTQSGEKRASVTQASTFALGVVTLFTGLGALVSATLGPFGMQALGSSVWVNGFIAVVFFAFGASLLGAFEITVPSGAMTSLNKYTQGSGLLPTLMMGLVFALASFACTGPFVGALLAGSVSGGGLAWPIFGMLMFSIGLALPFFLLALFPSYLSKLPKSGGWLSRTKITMGFLIVAVGIKYLSNVDQVYQWHLLTRERFLALWIVLFSMAGLYLLGLLKIDDDGSESVGLGRLASGGALLALAVSLIPGMFGGRLGEIDAYVPSAESSALQLAASGGGSVKGGWLKDDYDGALAQAEQESKNVLLFFTGYSCTNCKWMKTNMFPRPEIASAVDGLVVVELYTDGIDDATDANQALQLERFKTAAIPYYAIVTPDGETLGEFPGSTKNTEEFLEFLEKGAKSFLTEL